MIAFSFFLCAERFVDVCHHSYHSCLIFCDWYLLGSRRDRGLLSAHDLHTVFCKVLHYWSYGFGGGSTRRSAPCSHYLTSLFSQGKRKRLMHDCPFPFGFWKVGDFPKFACFFVRNSVVGPLLLSPVEDLCTEAYTCLKEGSLDTELSRTPLGKFLTYVSAYDS